MSLYSIGLSALNAAQMGVSTTGHNITNASNTYFHRQSISQTSGTPQSTGSGFLGTGTLVTNVTRSYNDFLDSQVREVSGQASYLSTYQSQISQVDDLLGSSDSSISTSLSSFYSALQTVSSTPASVSARQSLISSSQSLTSQFNTMANRLTDLYNGADQQIQSSVDQINSYTSQIAKLNGSIVKVESSSGGQEANDLHDQRDQLVSELNKIIQVDVTQDSSGFYNITTGNGQSLVVGTTASTLAAQRSASNPQKSDIYVTSGSSNVQLDSSSLSGGSLGALIDFRDETVTNARNELGKEALVFANAFNSQHELGQDLNGNIGGQVFTVSTPSVFSNANNTSSASLSASISNYTNLQASDYQVTYNGSSYDIKRLSDNTTMTPAQLLTNDGISFSVSGTPNTGDSFLIQPTAGGATNISSLITDTAKVAAALPLSTKSTTTNTGTASLTLSGLDSAAISNSSFPAYNSTTAMRTLTYSGGAYTSSTSGDTVTVSGNTLTLAMSGGGSLTMTISGTPASGDSFTVGRNNSGNADSTNANLLGKLATAKLTNNGTSTITESYAQLVSSVGSKASQIDTEYTSQSTLLTSVTSAQQSFSGVNLDEEAANLVQYQQAYQAAARIITTAQKMLDDIFNLMS